jgi:hypothetical protein
MNNKCNVVTWLGSQSRKHTLGQNEARHWWLTPVILATQEAEIRRIRIQSQPRQIVCKTLSRKCTSQEKADGVAQGVGPEFKPQYRRKTKKQKNKKKSIST